MCMLGVNVLCEKTVARGRGPAVSGVRVPAVSVAAVMSGDAAPSAPASSVQPCVGASYSASFFQYASTHDTAALSRWTAHVQLSRSAASSTHLVGRQYLRLLVANVIRDVPHTRALQVVCRCQRDGRLWRCVPCRGRHLCGSRVAHRAAWWRALLSACLEAIR